MEHLLSGAAAVEEKTKTSAANGDARESSPSPTLPAVKSEPSEPAPYAPLPKLPPISSLTHLRGMAPSLPSAVSTTGSSSTPVAVAPAGATRPSPGSLATHDEGLCRYRNKLCRHPRALKRNGELHNLCEKHRAKANQNQRKLESKRRVQKHQARNGATPAAAAPRTYQLTPAGAAPVLAVAPVHIHPQYQQQQHHFQLPAPPMAMRGSVGALPSLAQLHRVPPPSVSSSASSSPSPAGPAYPYYDGHHYPPYSR